VTRPQPRPAVRPPTKVTVRHGGIISQFRVSGSRGLPRGRIAKNGPIRTRSSPSDSAGGEGRKSTPGEGGGKGDLGGAPKVGKKRFFARRKNSQPSRAQGSRRRTPGVGARRGAKRLSSPTRRGRSAGERKSENRGKTGKNGVVSTTVRKNPRRHRSKRRPTDAAGGDRRVGAIGVDPGPSGEKSGSKNGREKVENSTIRGQRRSEPSADRSPSTQSDETRRSDAATRRPRRRKISSRSEERFGRRGRWRGTTRRPWREATETPIDAGRRRTRRRRGTDANRNEKQKKNRENRRRRSKVIDDFASVENRVRSKTSVRTHVTTATRSGIGPRSSRQRRRWRSGQSVGLSSRRWQVRFRGRTFLFFFAIEVCDESEISQTYRQLLTAAAVCLFKYSA
jgi:hypothetical protein